MRRLCYVIKADTAKELASLAEEFLKSRRAKWVLFGTFINRRLYRNDLYRYEQVYVREKDEKEVQ